MQSAQTSRLASLPSVDLVRPFGCVVHAGRPGQDLREIPVGDLRSLAMEHRLVVLRGFAMFATETFADYCATWGMLLKWNFGHVLDLKVHEEPKNYLFTNGSVPFHWDGAFAEAVPSFQCFQCLKAPLPGSGGETTFADTMTVWRDADADVRSLWDGISITYATEKLAHYGGRITARLVGRHPLLGEPTLRYNEPPDAQTSPLNTPTLEVDGAAPMQVNALLSNLRERLYSPRHCYAHAWNDGDFLIADNHALLHGRRAFLSHSPRHLQRVHIL